MCDLRELAKRYFEAIERGDEAALLGMLHPDVVQRELPNRLNPEGSISDRARMLERLKQGKKLLSSEAYAIKSSVCEGDRISLEVAWSGTIRGRQAMKASLAVFLDVCDGQIVSQRSYDCFDPF